VLLMVTLRFFRNGLIAPLIDYFTRGHVAAETVAKREVAAADAVDEAKSPSLPMIWLDMPN